MGLKLDRSGARIFRTLKIDLASVVEKNKAQAQVLGDGSLAVPAYISRTGCLPYEDLKGKPFVEYRDPLEVFSADSLASFEGVTVTELHPDSDVTPVNWRRHSIGHVTGVIAEGDYVKATLVVKDNEAIRKIQSKELREISCGYWADVSLEQGEFEGQHYDAIQKNIRGNHVAVGPGDWGRSGPEVRLLVDSKLSRKKDSTMMTLEEMKALLDKLATDGALTAEQADTLKGSLAGPEEPEVDGEDKEEEEDPKPEAKADVAALQAGFQRTLQIRDHARVFMGPTFQMPPSDDAIMLSVIRSEDPKFDAKNRSPEYVRARFDMCKPAPKQDAKTSTFDAEFVSIFSAEHKADEKTGSGNSIKDRQLAHYASMTGRK